MRILHISALALALTFSPMVQSLSQAQETEDEAPLSESIEQLFRDLMDEIGPTIDELSESLDIFKKIDSLEHYGSPEVLPNGDIIIRRREDAPPYVAPEDPGVRT